MAQMTSDVSARVSNAYSKVLDSDLNQTMKYLTIYSIHSLNSNNCIWFYGENVKLPSRMGPIHGFLQSSLLLS